MAAAFETDAGAADSALWIGSLEAAVLISAALLSEAAFESFAAPLLQAGSVTIHCIYAGAVCPTTGGTVTRAYSYEGDTVVSSD